MTAGIPPAPRVVFDCNVFFQAMVSPTGPSGACLVRARDGRLALSVSDYVLAEIRDLPNDPVIAAKFHLSSDKAERFIASFLDRVGRCDVVPDVYTHPYDPDDSHYVNLALATGSALVVSRDRHLRTL
jgi:putative PIN family toxin of toxin-antitoxin system